MIYQNEIFIPITNKFIPGILNNYKISNYGRIINISKNTFIGSFRKKYNRVKTSMKYSNNKICYDIDNAILEYCVFNNIPYDSSLRILFKDYNPQNLFIDNLYNQAYIENIKNGVIVSNPLISAAQYHIKDKKIMHYDIREEWINITDKEIYDIMPIYMISTFGRVYNKRYGSMVYLQIAYNGYINAYLRLKSGKYANVSVHRTMMKCFCPIENSDLYEVDHIDNDSLNNVITNLQWLSPEDNELKRHSSNNQIKFSDIDIHNICKGFESGMNPMQICFNILHVKYTGNMHARLMEIFRGIKHSDISSNYNFKFNDYPVAGSRAYIGE